MLKMLASSFLPCDPIEALGALCASLRKCLAYSRLIEKTFSKPIQPNLNLNCRSRFKCMRLEISKAISKSQ